MAGCHPCAEFPGDLGGRKADTHCYAAGNNRDGVWWNRTLSSRSLEIGGCLVEVLQAVAPDFVIHCGDLPGSAQRRD